MPDEHEALLRKPLGLALTQDGFLYVGETAHGRIAQISPSHQLRALNAIGDGATVRFKRPAGIALDRDGALYVSDAVNYLVRKVTPQAAMQNGPATTRVGADAAMPRRPAAI